MVCPPSVIQRIPCCRRVYRIFSKLPQKTVEEILYTSGGLPPNPETASTINANLEELKVYEKNMHLFLIITLIGIILIFVQLIARKRNQKTLPPSDAPFAIPKAPDSEH